MSDEQTKLKYEMTQPVVEYLLNALNRNQIAGVQQAKDLLTVTQLLQSPLNTEEIEKAKLAELKEKFEKK